MSNRMDSERASWRSGVMRLVLQGATAAIVVGVALPAFAVDPVVRGLEPDDSTDATYTYNIEACRDLFSAASLHITWTLGSTADGDYAIQRGTVCQDSFVISNEDCDEVVGPTDVPASGTIVLDQTAEATFGLADSTCESGTNTVAVQLNLIVDPTDSESATESESSFTFHSSRPASLGVAPTLQTGADRVTLNWEAVEGVDSYVVHYSTVAANLERSILPEPDRTQALASATTQETTQTVTGLTQGAEYFFVVLTIDDEGNRSLYPARAPVSATTAPSVSFWEDYRNSDGVEEGGCSTVSGSRDAWWLTFGFLAVAIGRRRRL